MSPTAITRITISAEAPGLLDAGKSFCAAHFANLELADVELEAFIDKLYADPEPHELLVVVMQADAEGHLGATKPMIQHLMNARTPVLVLRQNPDAQVQHHHLNRIVVPLDGSNTAGQAVPLAGKIAQLCGKPVKFVMVIDPSRVLPPAFAYDPDAWGVIEELRQTANWALSQAEENLRADGLTVSSDLLYGSINASLLTSVMDDDVVVMATHGLGRAGRKDSDSIAMRVLCSTPQPMFIMRASRQSEISVDGYEACSWVEPLNRKQVWKT